MTVPYQTDFKIVQNSNIGQNANEKVSIQLTNSGDITTTDGKSKLIEQILRALVNDNSFLTSALNSPDISKVKTLVTLILRNFRQSQLDETGRLEGGLTGYYIYRFGALDNPYNFVRVSKSIVTQSFTDTGLVNGFTYEYGITKLYRGISETAILEKLQVTPTQFVHKREYQIGQNFTVLPGDKSAKIYVNYNRMFKKDELLESIEEISVYRDNYDPRGIVVDVVVKNLAENKVSVTSKRLKIY